MAASELDAKLSSACLVVSAKLGERAVSNGVWCKTAHGWSASGEDVCARRDLGNSFRTVRHPFAGAFLAAFFDFPGVPLSGSLKLKGEEYSPATLRLRRLAFSLSGMLDGANKGPYKTYLWKVTDFPFYSPCVVRSLGSGEREECGRQRVIFYTLSHVPHFQCP